MSMLAATKLFYNNKQRNDPGEETAICE